MVKSSATSYVSNISNMTSLDVLYWMNFLVQLFIKVKLREEKDISFRQLSIDSKIGYGNVIDNKMGE